MYSRDFDSGKRTTDNERMNVLADLIALRNVGIKVTLTIKLAEVGERAPNCSADTQNMSDRFAIDNR